MRTHHQALLLAAIVAVLPASPLAQRAPVSRALVLTGGRVYTSPRDRPIEGGAVVIRDGRIVYVGGRNDRQVPKDATIIDCTGQVVVAGFWNSHVHFTDARWERAAAMPAAELSGQLQRMLVQYGFTTVLDSGSYWPVTSALRRRIETAELPGPRILSAGEILFPKGGALPPSMLASLGMIVGELPQVDAPASASALARTMLDRGADAIKVYIATWWTAPPVRMSGRAPSPRACRAHADTQAVASGTASRR